MYTINSKEKKLMILGGSRYIIPVIKAAHRLGIYVITCDYLPDNPAHEFADEYQNISITDREEVYKYAVRKKIDGIISFACDPGVVTAAYIAEKMGLPFQGSYESIKILQNKGEFRDFLQKHGFNAPKSRVLKETDDLIKSILGLSFPLIVKPVDSAGSKGVSKILSEKEIALAAQKAFDLSIKKEIIIEEYIDSVGCPSDSECFSIDGKLIFQSFSSQYFDENSPNPYVPVGFFWPATFTGEQKEYLTSEIQRLFRLLKLRTGIYNVETRVGKDGKAYIMELSPRGGGNRLAELIDYVYESNLIESTLLASIGEKVTIRNKGIKHNYAELVVHSNRDGIFHSLYVDKTLKNKIIDLDIWKKKGESVSAFMGANNTVGTIILKDIDRENFEIIKHNNLIHVEIEDKV